jgi:hypothetical protein
VRLACLFHVREYPQYSEAFPYDLGYCQRGSNVAAIDAHQRNILWVDSQAVGEEVRADLRGSATRLDASGTPPLAGEADAQRGKAGGWGGVMRGEETILVALNTGEGGRVREALVYPGLEELGTILETDFGFPIADLICIQSSVLTCAAEAARIRGGGAGAGAEGGGGGGGGGGESFHQRSGRGSCELGGGDAKSAEGAHEDASGEWRGKQAPPVDDVSVHARGDGYTVLVEPYPARVASDMSYR